MIAQKVHLAATEDIPQWSCVTSSGELADSNNPAHEGHVMGVTDGRMMSGLWGDVTVLGLLYNLGWSWTAGARLYLNGTVISETPPGVGFVQKVGWALTPQSMVVNIT